MSLIMVPAGNKAKGLSLVNHATKKLIIMVVKGSYWLLSSLKEGIHKKKIWIFIKFSEFLGTHQSLY